MSKINSPLPEQQVKPEAALERRTRRIFTADYKLKIIQKADLCQQGELGKLLRKERLYHSQLSDWRKEFELKGLSALNKSAPGPKSKLTLVQLSVYIRTLYVCNTRPSNRHLNGFPCISTHMFRCMDI